MHSRLVPAILTEDPQALETMVRQVETFTTYAQIDIMDGQFVPSRSITWEDIAPLSVKFAWEAHLMTLHPAEQLESYQQAMQALADFPAEKAEQKVKGQTVLRWFAIDTYEHFGEHLAHLNAWRREVETTEA